MTWTIPGGSGSGGLKLGPATNTFTGADLTAAAAARDAYFASNLTVLAAYDSNASNLIRLVYAGDTTFQGRSGGAWIDYTPVLQGEPGSVASLVNVPIGQVPYKLPDGTFGGSRMRVLDDGSLLAPPNFGVESGSVKFGDVLTLSEAAGFLAISNHLNGKNYTLLDYPTPRDAASGSPSQFRLTEAEHVFVAQGVSTTQLTTNPLVLQYTVQNTARTNALTYKTFAAMSNVRFRIVKQSNGVTVKYVPSKEVWETEVGGLTWGVGDNTFDFSDTPIIFNAGDVIRFEIYATSVSLLGNASGIPYLTSTLQLGEFHDVVMDDQYTATDVRNKLTSLTGSSRLDITAVKNAVTLVAGRSGVVALTTTDISGLATVASTGAYSDLIGLPTIPTNTNQLTNGANFITASQAPVQSVQGRTGAVIVSAADVGLGNVDNTSDINAPTSTAQQASIDLKMAQHNAAADPHPFYTTTVEAAAAAPVQTVNALTGNVVLTTGNVTESGNLYYTDARVQTYVAGQGGFNLKTASSIGAGAAVYSGTVSNDLRFRSIIGTGAATVTQNTNDITINVPAATVSSVNGQTGVVSLSTTNINEGTNLYYTDTRVTTYLSGAGYTVKSITSGGSGANLIASQSSGVATLRSIIGTGIATVTQNSNDITINVPANAVSSVNGQTGAVILNTANVAELTNLYYTDARVSTWVTTNGYVVKTLASVGAGSSLVANVGPSATIRSLIGTNGITVTQNANDVTISAPVLAGGVYTPTVANAANTSATTAYACQWIRVDGAVTVSGKVDIDPVTNGQATRISMTLPVASALTTQQQVGGVASCIDAAQVAGIYADTVGDRAFFEFIAVSTTNRSFYFTFTYQVI